MPGANNASSDFQRVLTPEKAALAAGHPVSSPAK
jgi:hypothetical protein